MGLTASSTRWARGRWTRVIAFAHDPSREAAGYPATGWFVYQSFLPPGETERTRFVSGPYRTRIRAFLEATLQVGDIGRLEERRIESALAVLQPNRAEALRRLKG